MVGCGFTREVELGVIKILPRGRRQMMKRRGPRIKPWGTPEVTVVG